MAVSSLTLSLPTIPSLSPRPSSTAASSSSSSSSFSSSPPPSSSVCCRLCGPYPRCSFIVKGFLPHRITPVISHSRRTERHIVCMAPDEEKMTRRSPLDFPIEWERPKPGRRPDIFPQFSPMKTPLPPPLPADPPEEDEEEEEKKEEDEEDPEKEETDKPDKK